MTGACEFCGQVVTHDEGREPWEVCQCKEAQDRQRRDEAIKQALDGAERIFGESCIEIGFVPVDETTMNIIKDLIVDVGYGRIRSLTVKINNGETVQIKMDNLEITLARKQQKKAVA